jgi:hypothetical protein
MIVLADDGVIELPQEQGDVTPILQAMITRIYGNESIGYLPEAHTLRHLEFLEQELLKFPQQDMPVRHYVVPGMVAREMIAPADTIIIGKIHRHPQINVLSEGEMSMLGEHGMVRVSAGFTVVTPAGTKRAAYAHTRCKWTTFVAVDVPSGLTSDQIGDLLTYKSVDSYLASLPPLQQTLQLEEAST